MRIVPEIGDYLTNTLVQEVYVLLDEVLALRVLAYTCVHGFKHISRDRSEEFQQILKRCIVRVVPEQVVFDAVEVCIDLVSKFLSSRQQTLFVVIDLDNAIDVLPEFDLQGVVDLLGGSLRAAESCGPFHALRFCVGHKMKQPITHVDLEGKSGFLRFLHILQNKFLALDHLDLSFWADICMGQLDALQILVHGEVVESIDFHPGG
jgi:hypothetical protein